MINLSLDLFKMERGLYEFQPSCVDMIPLIRKILIELKPLADKHHQSGEIWLNDRIAEEEDHFFVYGEELLCYSLMSNLLKNAFESSPPKEQITAELFCKPESAMIRIHNMGAVPENIRDRFFEKYATSGKKQGTGLGTYSARLIAETQGGSISMQTSEKSGTTITVQLKGVQGEEGWGKRGERGES
jgi:K+-sensing histidine kinase KdpD